jgi:hypothetical protein
MVFEHYINDFPLEVIYIKPSKIANVANMIFVFCMIKMTFKITNHSVVVVATDDENNSLFSILKIYAFSSDTFDISLNHEV